jgi:hypothetical protein
MRERKKIAHTAFTNHSRFSILILRSLRHAAGGRAEGAGVVIVMSTDINAKQTLERPLDNTERMHERLLPGACLVCHDG